MAQKVERPLAIEGRADCRPVQKRGVRQMQQPLDGLRYALPSFHQLPSLVVAFDGEPAVGVRDIEGRLSQGAAPWSGGRKMYGISPHAGPCNRAGNPANGEGVKRGFVRIDEFGAGRFTLVNRGAAAIPRVVAHGLQPLVLKECRRVLTRFEKRAANFLGMIKMAFIQRYLRIMC
jgi:hypothetical protein